MFGRGLSAKATLAYCRGDQRTLQSIRVPLCLGGAHARPAQKAGRYLAVAQLSVHLLFWAVSCDHLISSVCKVLSVWLRLLDPSR